MGKESPSDHTCIKCGHSFRGNYCPNCGLEVKSGRLDTGKFISETVKSLDIDRGFFRTCIILLSKPGPAIRIYLRENRHSLYGPVKFVLILGAAVTYLVFRYDVFTPSVDDQFFTSLLSNWSGYVYYSGKYFSFFSFTSIPLFTLSSWLLFKAAKFSLVENLILNLYILGGQFLINIIYVIFPLALNLDILELLGVINAGYNIWVLATFFPGEIIPKTIRSVFAVVIPQIGMFFINYFIYKLAPASAWEMLDLI